MIERRSYFNKRRANQRSVIRQEIMTQHSDLAGLALRVVIAAHSSERHFTPTTSRARPEALAVVLSGDKSSRIDAVSPKADLSRFEPRSTRGRKERPDYRDGNVCRARVIGIASPGFPG